MAQGTRTLPGRPACALRAEPLRHGESLGERVEWPDREPVRGIGDSPEQARGCTARQHRAGHCDAERGADLARRVVHGRGDALLFVGNGAHDRRSRRRSAQSDAGADDQQRPGEIRGTVDPASSMRMQNSPRRSDRPTAPPTADPAWEHTRCMVAPSTMIGPRTA